MTLSFSLDRTLYSYHFVFSCRHRCNILYGFYVEYSLLLSLGQINISCFLHCLSRRFLNELILGAVTATSGK